MVVGKMISKASELIANNVSAHGVPHAPTEIEWHDLIKNKRQSTSDNSPTDDVVDVIIPVYDGFDETMACVFAAVETTFHAACEIVVINDGSPSMRLVEALERWAAEGLFTLHNNDKNYGFVRTVNRGMALHGERDVVLLNSDALVYGDWLTRMRQVAISRPKVATVTPFSNNAEICSYPEFVKNNTDALEVNDSSLDALAAKYNDGRVIELPTGVGFCMYIRRPCLDEVGYFDEKKFGKGYGEENDFCLRAGAKGWVHLLAANVFARHCGGVSFGSNKQQLVLNGLRVLARDWPNYDRDIQRFVAADPVFPVRRELDAARVFCAERHRKTILFISHDWGGGIERHIQEMIAMLRIDGIGVIVMRAPRHREGWVELDHGDMNQLPNLRYSIIDDRDELLALLKGIGIFHIHVHSLAGYPMNAGEFIQHLAHDLGVAYDFTLHDYLPVCPRITMINESGVYCGDPSADDCARCIAKLGAPVEMDTVPTHRDRYRRFLAGARSVFAPSHDAARRCVAWFSTLDVIVRPHVHTYRFPLPPPVRYSGEGILRVAIIGAIGPHKGSSLLLECARDAERRSLPIRFVVFGITDKPELDNQSVISVTGAYGEGDVGRLLKEHRCHMAFFASVWPETWSYTLSEAFDAGLFPVAFELGAAAERIRDVGWGQCLPIELMTRANRVNDALLAIHCGKFTPEIQDRIRATSPMYAHPLRDYYDLAG